MTPANPKSHRDVAWYASLIGGVIAVLAFVGVESIYDLGFRAPKEVEVQHRAATNESPGDAPGEGFMSESEKESSMETAIVGSWRPTNWFRARLTFYGDGGFRMVSQSTTPAYGELCDQGSYRFLASDRVEVRCSRERKAVWEVRMMNEELYVDVKDGFGPGGVYTRIR